GRYNFTALASKITTTFNGFPMDGNQDGTAGDSVVITTVATPTLPVTGTSADPSVNGIGIARFFGDSDGDGDADVFDVLAFRATFGRSSPDPFYSNTFDFDNDGDVDAADLLQFKTRFGNSV